MSLDLMTILILMLTQKIYILHITCKGALVAFEYFLEASHFCLTFSSNRVVDQRMHKAHQVQAVHVLDGYFRKL
jgi:hypothetical protein